MAVVKTDFGVAWVNKQGVYLYNGQGGVSNLLEREANRVISLSTDTAPAQVDNQPWDSFVTDQTAIGYSPLHRKIFVKKAVGAGANSNHATSSADLYIFDIPSQSWTFHKANATDDPVQDCSGFFIDQNKDLVFFQEASGGAALTIDKWTQAPQSVDEFSFWTRNFDLSDTYARKTIYKIAIRAKNGSSMPVHYSTDGGETKTSCGNLGSTDGWVELATNMPVEDIYQIMFGFNVANAVVVDSDFELYEINIVYRRKKVTSQ